MLFESCFYLNSVLLHWKDQVLIYTFSTWVCKVKMFLCELVDFQNCVEISGAKTNTKNKQDTEIYLHINL